MYVGKTEVIYAA